MQPNYQRFLFQNLTPERQMEVLQKSASMKRQRELLEEQIREKQQRKEFEQNLYTQKHSQSRFSQTQNIGYSQSRQYFPQKNQFSNTFSSLPPITIQLLPRQQPQRTYNSTFNSPLPEHKMNLNLNPTTIHTSFDALRTKVRSSAPTSRLHSPHRD